MLAKKACKVWPLSVLPAKSLTVTLSIIGIFLPFAAITDSAASIATLAFSVSKMVSISKISIPPSIIASICS